MASLILSTILITPIGRLLLHTSDKYLYGVDLLTNNTDADAETGHGISPLTQETIEQFNAYFIDAQSRWTLPLAERGTVFQRKVWQYLQTIPPGETQTYSDIAQVLGTSARAVGNACRANPFAIVIPCHRVISKLGLGGYFGKKEGGEIDLKQWLLDHERRSCHE